MSHSVKPHISGQCDLLKCCNE